MAISVRQFGDDLELVGYWFEKTSNNVSGAGGLFTILHQMESSAYTGDMGNPLPVWRMGIEGTNNYKGIEYTELDHLFLQHSGYKKVKKYWLWHFTRYFQLYPNNPFRDFVLYCTRLYSKKWTDMWETMFYDYDPIENYNMIEQLTDDVRETEYGKKDTLTITQMQHVKSGSETTTPGVVTTETDTVYGYNSTNGETANKRVTTPSGNESHVYNNVTDTDTGSSNNQLSGSDTETRNYTLTRKGNIGVTTSQQMIEQQRTLLMLDYFNDIVFPDIDKVLCLQVY